MQPDKSSEPVVLTQQTMINPHNDTLREQEATPNEGSSKRSALIIALITLCLVSVLIWFGLTLSHKVKGIEDHWTTLNHEAVASYYALNRIKTSFGYGGFIHNFNNYVLRKDPGLVPTIDTSLHATYEAIDDYALTIKHDDAGKALEAIRKTVDIYAKNFVYAQKLVANGTPSNEIDIKVKVDDKPALQAIEFLNRQAILYRLNKEKETKELLDITLQFLNRGAFLIPFLFIMSGTLIFFLHKVVTTGRLLLSASRHRNDIFNAAPDAMLIVNTRGEIEEVNKAVLELIGYKPDELIGNKIEMLVPQRYRNHHKQLRDGAFGSAQHRALSNAMELTVLTKDGIELPVEIGISYTLREGRTYAITSLRDVRERKQAEDKLRLADNVFSHSTEAILVTDTEFNILRVNEAFCRTTGYSTQEALGRNPWDLLKSGRHDEDFFRALCCKLKETGYWEGEITERRKDGKSFPAYHNINTVRDQAGEIIQYISIFSDITEEKRVTEHIQYLAQYDQLTKLPNRMLFNDRLRHAITRAKRARKILGLMFIDLDRFKSVNDTLGHQAGDLLLQVAGKRLLDTVRAQDTVARLGGDEFTIILEDLAHAEDAANVANKVLSALQEKIIIDGNEIFIGGSIGISIYPTDGENSETMVKSADMAMYQAKQQGRNRYQFYTDELADFAERRFHTESRLRQAIDTDELELYYQPQVNIFDGKLVGAEALVRWNDPDKGLVSPAEFIPVAEETGLIGVLGDWVLRTACIQAEKWRDQGFAPLRMTVNVAGYQIMHGSIVESTRKVLKETGLPPELLELEITEGFVMNHPKRGVAILNELKELGVSLAIDDFGTGYSSLSYLKRLPLDRLKIDRSFVMDIPHDKDDEAIVSTIIAMAKNLGLTVIAEGVENEDQIHFLTGQNCFEVQGFYFSKPIPSKLFSRLFLASQASVRKHLASTHNRQSPIETPSPVNIAEAGVE